MQRRRGAEFSNGALRSRGIGKRHSSPPARVDRSWRYYTLLFLIAAACLLVPYYAVRSNSSASFFVAELVEQVRETFRVRCENTEYTLPKGGTTQELATLNVIVFHETVPQFQRYGSDRRLMQILYSLRLQVETFV